MPPASWWELPLDAAGTAPDPASSALDAAGAARAAAGVPLSELSVSGGPSVSGPGRLSGVAFASAASARLGPNSSFARSLATSSADTVAAWLPQLVRAQVATAATWSSSSFHQNAGIASGVGARLVGARCAPARM